MRHTIVCRLIIGNGWSQIALGLNTSSTTTRTISPRTRRCGTCGGRWKTRVVAWAAGNGDRSENADYLYGKRRLRQIDSRIRFLTKRIDAAVVVDPAAPRSGSAATRVFFGATVTYKDAVGLEHVVSIVGIDEVDLDRGHISWRSPLANALMKASPGDRVQLRAPAKTEHLEVIEVEYSPI